MVDAGSLSCSLCLRSRADFGKLLAQRFIFLLEVLDTLLHIFHSLAQFIYRIAGSDVLRTIPVIRFDVDNKYPLDWSLLFRHTNLLQPALSLSAFEDLHPSQYLQAGLPRVVDHDHGDPAVGLQISRADVLFVSPKICERQGMVVNHFEEALSPAAM